MDQDSLTGLGVFLVLLGLLWWLYHKFCAKTTGGSFEIPTSDSEVQFFRFVFEAFDKSKKVKGKRFLSSYESECRRVGHKQVDWNNVNGLNVKTRAGNGYTRALEQIVAKLKQIKMNKFVADELKAADDCVIKVINKRQRDLANHSANRDEVYDKHKYALAPKWGTGAKKGTLTKFNAKHKNKHILKKLFSEKKVQVFLKNYFFLK